MRRGVRLAVLIVLLGLVSSGAASAQTAGVLPRIDPAGIDGTLLLCGRGEIQDAVLARFLNIAGGKKGQISLLHFGDKDHDATSDARRLLELAHAGGTAAELVRVDGNTPADDKVSASLSHATGLWLSGDPERMRAVCSTGKLADSIRALKKRGGIVGTATSADVCGRVSRLSGQTSSGLNWLPDGLVIADKLEHPDKLWPRTQALVGYQLEPGAALLVRGRNLEALGAGDVIVHLAATAQRSAMRLPLRGRKETDLTLLRRAARDRAAGIPPMQPGVPVVEKGTLVIVGGGKMPAGLTKQFVDLAGGDKAVIVILPTALPDPIPNQNALADSFRRYGARVTVLPGRTRGDVDSPASLDALAAATGIWFGGGRQWRFVDAYEDTKALKLMHDVLQRGGVIGGTSAGASIQAEYLARGSPYGNLEIIAEGYERGLGFLKGVAIDQHFTQRRRHGEMSTLMKTWPQFLGIGIDEATALIVRGSTAEVVGQGQAFFYDPRRTIASGEPDYQAVPASGRFDLRERRVVTQE